jgi:hypothetical protein
MADRLLAYLRKVMSLPQTRVARVQIADRRRDGGKKRREQVPPGRLLTVGKIDDRRLSHPTLVAPRPAPIQFEAKLGIRVPAEAARP